MGFWLDGLPSAVASAIYSHAQAQEQEWEEKNRVRDLEEKRAISDSEYQELKAKIISKAA